MITHLEPDILECEVKCALGSITTNKASGGGRIPSVQFQFQKDDTIKVLYSICQQIMENSAVGFLLRTGKRNWKRSVFIPIPKKGNAKEYSNYCTIAFISHYGINHYNIVK